MIYDILVVAILLISVIIGYNRGAARTIVSLVGFLLSFVLAALLGDYFADIIYDGYIAQAIVDSVSTSVSQSTATTFTTAQLPPFVSFSMLLTGFDYEAALSNATQTLPDAIASGFEAAIRPVVMSVLTCVLTALVFFVLYFIFRFILLKVLTFVFNLPVIRGLNKLLGVVFSLISALLLVSFIAFLLHLVMPYITDMPYYLSESTIYNSYIFYHFYSGNIFTALTSII